MNKFFLYISNSLILMGLCAIMYYIFIIEPKRNVEIQKKFSSIQQVAASVIIYKNEPETVRQLAQDIIKTAASFDEIKRKDLNQ